MLGLPSTKGMATNRYELGTGHDVDNAIDSRDDGGDEGDAHSAWQGRE